MHDRPGYTREMVQALAYCLWLDDGCPEDNEWKYWFMAEQQLESERIRHDPQFAKLVEILCGNDGKGR